MKEKQFRKALIHKNTAKSNQIPAIADKQSSQDTSKSTHSLGLRVVPLLLLVGRLSTLS